MRKYYIFFTILSVCILVILIVGFQMAGNPLDQQAKTQDNTRLSDFSELKYQVENYYRTNSKLPTNLSQIPISSFVHLNDPKTKVPYTYNIISGMSYSLCTEFATEQQSTDTFSSSLNHKKGYDCIVNTIPSYMTVTPTPTPASISWFDMRRVGYWKLDSLNPAYGVFDEIPEENNGIISNVKEVDGKINKAGSFMGTSNSYIDITQNKQISQITNDFTLDLWTYRYDTGSRAIASTTNNTDGGFGMFVGNSGEVYCRTSGGGGLYSDSYSSYNGDRRLTADSGWRFVAIVKKGSVCKVYIDGYDVTVKKDYHDTFIPSSNPLTLGGTPNHSSDAMYSGLIDNVRLYNYARTQSEIQEDMDMATPDFKKFTPILLKNTL